MVLYKLHGASWIKAAFSKAKYLLHN